MSKTCLVFNCKTRGNIPGITYHRLGTKRHTSWLQAIGRSTQENLSLHNVICSKHFEKSDFTFINGKTTLKANSVPKLFLPKNATLLPLQDGDSLKKARIPSELKNDWLKAMGRHHAYKLMTNYRICSEHFAAKDFRVIGDKKFLKKDSVPSLKVPSKEYVQYDFTKPLSMSFNKMPKCCVSSCINGTSNTRRKPGLTFHRFPKNLYKEWIKALGKEQSFEVYFNYVCSEHFTKDDFELHSAKKRLKDGVIPTQKIGKENDEHAVSQSKFDRKGLFITSALQSPVNLKSPENLSEDAIFVEENDINYDEIQEQSEGDCDEVPEQIYIAQKKMIDTFHSYSKVHKADFRYADEQEEIREELKQCRKQLIATQKMNWKRQQRVLSQRQTILELKKQLFMATKALRGAERQLAIQKNAKRIRGYQ